MNEREKKKMFVKKCECHFIPTDRKIVLFHCNVSRFSESWFLFTFLLAFPFRVICNAGVRLRAISDCYVESIIFNGDLASLCLYVCERG